MKTAVPWYNRTSIPLAVALFFGVLGWLLYTALEAVFFPSIPFPQLLLTNIQPYDLVLRLIVSGLFFFLGIIIVDNIAKQHYREHTLSEANETLSLRNTSLEHQLKEKTGEIDSLLAQKHNLIIGLSHDLNTPLTPLMGLLPIIIKEEQNPRLKELLILSLRNVHYIRDLVSRAIDLSLLDSTILSLSLEKTNLCTEVDAVLENKAASIQDHHVFIDNKIDEHLYVNADKQRLREVIQNILTNSITYSEPEGCIITLEATPSREDIIVSITDTGIGLTPEQVHHMFDELYKADEARHNHKKTGLGLTICKRIVEKHGGKIWAESKGLGKGTTVHFTIPSAIDLHTRS